jgi:hypothetical protein
MKMNNKKVGRYDSKLEKYCAERLTEEEIPFRFQGEKYELHPKFRYPGISLEKVGKTFKQQRTGQTRITYTPDFIGEGWIIETKGHRTPSFNLKWKLFKKYLLDNNLSYDLYMPTNQKQVRQCIEEIKRKLKQSTKY